MAEGRTRAAAAREGANPGEAFSPSAWATGRTAGLPAAG